jgi:hypothetical protein
MRFVLKSRFYPDSYDAWVPSRPGEQYPPLSDVARPWRVTSRWIADTDRFNEWMNERDYLFEEVREISCSGWT